MKTLRLAVILLIPAFPASAMTEKVEHYPVRGKSTKALITSLNMFGPNGAWAVTQTKWTYSYKFKLANGFYKITEANAKRTTVFKMPDWTGYASASVCMKKSWDAMYINLAKHEVEHWKKAAGVSAKIEAALMAVKPQRTKPALERAATTAANAVINLNRTVQMRFDKDTRHGAADPVNPVVLARCPNK